MAPFAKSRKCYNCVPGVFFFLSNLFSSAKFGQFGVDLFKKLIVYEATSEGMKGSCDHRMMLIKVLVFNYFRLKSPRILLRTIPNVFNNFKRARNWFKKSLSDLKPVKNGFLLIEHGKKVYKLH